MNRQVSDRRLLKLAAFLHELPRKRFDFDHWVGSDWNGAQNLSCGTTACALGWAATMPVFRRLGLRLQKSTFSSYVDWPGHGNNFFAAAELFGLEYDEAKFLFEPGDEWDGDPRPGSKATPKQVAKHIERFVKDRQKATA